LQAHVDSVSICVIGSGYVGWLRPFVLPRWATALSAWTTTKPGLVPSEGGVPIYEEHLPELLAKHRNGIGIHDRLVEAVERSEAIFVAVGTPQGDNGAADMSYVESVVAEIAHVIDATRSSLRRALSRSTPTSGLTVCCAVTVSSRADDVVSNPEFLREARPIKDFLHPDRIVVAQAANDPRS